MHFGREKLKKTFQSNCNRDFVHKKHYCNISFPNYIGFDHISRDDVILKHMTTFAREYLARGSNITAIL